MNYCPHCGAYINNWTPQRPWNPYTPYTPYPIYPYWFSTAGSGGGEGIKDYQNKGESNGTQRSPQN